MLRSAVRVVAHAGVRSVTPSVSRLTAKAWASPRLWTTVFATAWLSWIPSRGFRQVKDKKLHGKLEQNKEADKDSVPTADGKQQAPSVSPPPKSRRNGRGTANKQTSFEAIVAGNPGYYAGDRFLVNMTPGITRDEVVDAMWLKYIEISALFPDHIIHLMVGKTGIQGAGDNWDKNDPTTWDSSVGMSKRFVSHARDGYHFMVPICVCDNQTSVAVMGYRVADAERFALDLEEDLQKLIPLRTNQRPTLYQAGHHDGNIKDAYVVYFAFKLVPK